MTLGLFLHMIMTLVFSAFIGLSMTHLFVSSLISWLLLLLIEPVFDTDKYATRLLRGLTFFAIQIKSIVTSSLVLSFKLVTRQDRHFSPVLIKVPLHDYSPTEIMIASYAINLSPGSAVVCVDTKTKTLHVHILDSESKETAVSDIESSIFTPILRFTRS